MKKQSLDKATNPTDTTMTPPLVIVLDNIRSGHNVGAAFRIADAFSIEKIYICGITPTPPHREIRKTALGAEETVAWEQTPTVTAALSALQEQAYHIIGIEQTAHSLPLDLAASNHRHTPTALVFGNEVWGVSEEALAFADTCLEIPQYGKKKSLNVATCIAIVTWEWTKRR